jgi:choline kinase
MRAIILAAGSGLRLGEFTQDIPKTLVDVNGESILERQISLLKEYGINEIFVVTGYKREKHVLKNIEYIFNARYSETEQLTSMMVARGKIFGDVLIIFGDIIFDSDILQQVLASNDDITIPIDLDWKKSYEEEPNKPADIFWLNRKEIGKISAKEISLESKNEVGEFLGIIKLSAAGSKILVKKYEELEKSHTGKFHDADSLNKAKLVDILQELIDSKIEISPLIISGKWCEIDTPKDLERAKKIFKNIDIE